VKQSIFHISHTDVTYGESRIIKQLEDIKNKFLNYNIFVIGIKKQSNINNNKSSSHRIKDFSVSLITKKLFFLPKFVRYFFNYLEFLIKCIFIIYNKKITIVHCHFFTVLPIGYVVKLLFKCKLIYDAHELESHKNFVKYPRIIFLIEKFLWKKIDLFITVSPSILNWYNEKFGYKKNSIIILNSPKIKNHITIEKNMLRKKLKISKNTLIFIYVGGLQNGRGIHHMLKSFSNPTINSHLVFVGSGILENEIKKFSKKNDNIHILKPVAHNTLVKFISSANVGLSIIEKVSLSDFYCLPNKFFEYAFANLYILASNFPDMKKLIKTYSLGSCISPNTNSLIRKIKFLENNKKKIKVLKRNLVDLQWQSQSQILIRSYLNILKKTER
jgi:glycosyltransferase involved in cell wall biosynthesis